MFTALKTKLKTTFIDCSSSTNFTWSKPIPPTETTGEEDEEVDDSELNLDKVEEEMAADYSDEEEEEILHIDDLQAALPGNAVADLEMAKPSEILPSTTDSEAWNIEVERVAPKLKVTVRVDGRDWRSHLEQVSFLPLIMWVEPWFAFDSPDKKG